MIRLLQGFQKKYFKDAHAACVTGSFVDGHYTTESDVDVWVITKSRDYFFTETIMYNKVKIQVSHFPLKRVSEILWLDHVNGKGVHIGAFAKSQILSDTDGYLQNIVSACKEQFEVGPKGISHLDLYIKKIRLLEAVNDLTSSKSHDESCVLIAEAFSFFLSFFTAYSKIWDLGGKHTIRLLKEKEPSMVHELIGRYNEFFVTQKSASFIEFVNSKLSAFSDHSNGYSSYNGLIDIKEEYLVIQFYNIKSYYGFLKEMHEALSSIFKRKSLGFYFFRSRPIGDTNNPMQSIYFVVFDQPDGKYNDVIPYLNQAFDRLIKFGRPRYSFPINLDLSLVYGQKSVVKPIAVFLRKLSYWAANAVIDESKSIAAAILFFLSFKDVFFGDDTVFAAFVRYLYDAWKCEAYDSGRIFGYEQMLIALKNIEASFLHQFTTQKDTIEKITLLNRIFIEELAQLKPEFEHKDQESAFPANVLLGNIRGVSDKFSMYKDFLNVTLGTLLVSEEQKAYIPFVILRLIK